MMPMVAQKPEPSWNKKRIVITLAALVIILSAVSYLFVQIIQDDLKGEYVTLSSDGIVVNNTETGEYTLRQEKFYEEAYIDQRQDVVVNTETYAHVFFSQGMYKGKYFNYQYIDEDGNVRMKIGQNMTPSDGIPESYLLVKIEEPNVIANVYLDDDWRKLIAENTTVVYGKNFENEILFNWNEVAPELYMTSIVQPTADEYRRDTMHAPSVNIAILDRPRYYVFTVNTGNVTMVLYR